MVCGRAENRMTIFVLCAVLVIRPWPACDLEPLNRTDYENDGKVSFWSRLLLPVLQRRWLRTADYACRFEVGKVFQIMFVQC